MKVKDLIKELQELDPTQDLNIVLHDYFGEADFELVEMKIGLSDHTGKKVVIIGNQKC